MCEWVHEVWGNTCPMTVIDEDGTRQHREISTKGTLELALSLMSYRHFSVLSHSMWLIAVSGGNDTVSPGELCSSKV